MTTPSAPEPRGQELPESLPVADLLGLLADLPDDEYVCIIPQKRLIAQAERIRKLEDFAGKSLVLNREIARLQREAEGLRRENQELRAAHYDATDGISGTLLKDQIEALTRERDEARRVVHKVYRWAQQRCPCDNESPDPCTLCDARVDAIGEAGRCKAVPVTFPPSLRRDMEYIPHPASETQG